MVSLEDDQSVKIVGKRLSQRCFHLFLEIKKLLLLITYLKDEVESEVNRYYM